MFEKAGLFYNSMYAVGFALMMIINLKTHEKHTITKKNAVLYTIYTYICGVIGAMIMGRIYSAVSAHYGVNEPSKVAIFGAIIFVPLLIMIFPLKKGDYKHVVDMLAPGVLVILLCAKFGCFIFGCCHGKVSSFGVHYIGADEKYFPVQIFEVISMLIVLALTQLYFKKTKNFTAGTAYPITFAAYSVTRFFWEFFRYYPNEKLENVFLHMTFMQLCCVLVFTVSVILVAVLKSRQKKAALIKEN